MCIRDRYFVAFVPILETKISVPLLTVATTDVLAICEVSTVVKNDTPPTFNPLNAAFSNAPSKSSPFQIDVANVINAVIPNASFATIRCV